ncbi:MAG TPA: lysophospholipid acyltransferase family protein [Caulobacteraceae bacterium]|nr:lysophospholipid acyltransferase family protein [Caulobacteraceae bacterium]
MTYARSLLFAALFYLWSLALVNLCLPVLLAPRSWLTAAFRFWARGVVVLLRVCCDIRVEVRGREHVPTGRALVAAKHQCMFDVFAQFVTLPDACFVMRKELAWIPYFGWYAWKGRMIVIDREGGTSALRQMVRDGKDRLAEERQILIFPEGHRGEPGHAGDYQPGVAGLYRDLGLPTHLVATNSGVHWPAHGILRRPGTIVFEFLPPLPAGLKRAEFMREMQDRIETASNALLEL